VLDTGVRFTHPDLGRAVTGGKLLPGYDFVSADSDGSFATANDGDGWDDDPSDPGDYLTEEDLEKAPFEGKGCGANGADDAPVNSSWHGTRVSGLIAAAADNFIGIAGAGFNLRVLPVRVLGRCGGHLSDVLAGMYWAAGLSVPQALAAGAGAGAPPPNPYPAQIINLSLGNPGLCTHLYSDAVAELAAQGVIIVASAGNGGVAVDEPANCAGVVAVAGLRHDGAKVGYSNLGPEVSIAAPSGNCVFTGVAEPCLFSLDTTTNLGRTRPRASGYTDQYNFNIGTSFSAPLVAATLGLMETVNPQLPTSRLIARLKESATPFPDTFAQAVPELPAPTPPACRLPEMNLVQEATCTCNTQVCGAGMLDAGAAVSAAARPDAVARMSGTVGVNLPLTFNGADSSAAAGRNLVAYQWSVVGVTGGAALPAIVNADQRIASVLSPASGG
jgi:serine protease